MTSSPFIHHFHIDHNVTCLPPKILHNHCFQFLLGITVVPREIVYHGCAQLRSKQGALWPLWKWWIMGYQLICFWQGINVHQVKLNEPQLQNSPKSQQIYLFTDTATRLKLLDLKIIMGCPEGPRSVFKLAFRAKRELHCAFLRKKAIIFTTKQGKTIFFPITIFF